MTPAQPFSVKRAEVEFHNFASLGEPERNLPVYAEENARRGGLIRKHQAFIGEMTPFLEIGANAGHSSYMLANEFGASGFALDISADSLRHGRALMDAWNLERAPVRLAGDAANLPFADASVRFVCAFQMLSQFLDIESVFREVARVLQPGGVFLFAEEPLRRKLSLRLYRCAYYNTMKPWERKLYDWGLLGYLVRDVIGAHQEESFGIRQNHSMGLAEWHALAAKYFTEQEYEIFVAEEGWGERIVQIAAGSKWRAARWLGGTLAAVLKKPGVPAAPAAFEQFERCLRCPDCHAALTRDAHDVLCCIACNYTAENEGEVYNLLPSAERSELYPGERDDIIDFGLPGHERQLLEGWYELEGVYGNKYRWIGAQASARLRRVKPGPQRLRIRGHASPPGIPGEVRATVNGAVVGTWKLDRPGLFLLEGDLPLADEYTVTINASPTFTIDTDDRTFTVNLSMIRLVGEQTNEPRH
ncbi:MAG: class I SAM-dependent methyltransferase [Bryobacterales bacterium]|nr:class I SAM-dependent methyltransferase [Bryobacterales bacterium]MBV9397771.1 class I SAM-dependent methyltransferase [Bryobacterales bacterium]